MRVSRRTLIASLAAAPAAALSSKTVFAADYPDRPIHLIVPFAPGGNADIVGRITGQLMGDGLKGTVVVENHDGAGGSVGAAYVAHATPDGYTLLVGSNGPLTINPILHAHLGYDPLKDFVAVALTSYVPHALIMSTKSGAKTLADVIAMSKKAPVTVATSGVGSATHMTLERLKAATGADFTHVPYRGGGALIADLIGGNVDGAMTEFSTALPLHQSGKAHIVAIASAHRSALATDIPTFEESGVKDFTAQSYIGVVAPAKTPSDIVARLQSVIAEGLKPDSPAAARLKSLGSEVATPEQMTSQGFAAFIRADYAAMQAAAKVAGLKAE
ncbi:MAG TPA: tripartite tricarboxylate transporter substrate binding protein [Xanthobacteraceae bacterium]|jgi:tripartite-type tricarboxylate transporter receptor subunit TctC|nr:tripartite tricarboxylate transporter substrate binding protein [Xanthobacteraceae bacterium]